VLEKKVPYWLPSRHRQLLLALVVSGFSRARGSAGFDRCAAVAPPPSSGIVAGPSTATISAPLPGTLGYSSAAAPAADGSAARIPSAGNTADAADARIVSVAQPLAFCADL
jgi:hypothetical protein